MMTMTRMRINNNYEYNDDDNNDTDNIDDDYDDDTFNLVQLSMSSLSSHLYWAIDEGSETPGTSLRWGPTWKHQAVHIIVSNTIQIAVQPCLKVNLFEQPYFLAGACVSCKAVIPILWECWTLYLVRCLWKTTQQSTSLLLTCRVSWWSQQKLQADSTSNKWACLLGCYQVSLRKCSAIFYGEAIKQTKHGNILSCQQYPSLSPVTQKVQIGLWEKGM